jgi:hypothetical protein
MAETGGGPLAGDDPRGPAAERGLRNAATRATDAGPANCSTGASPTVALTQEDIESVAVLFGAIKALRAPRPADIEQLTLVGALVTPADTILFRGADCRGAPWWSGLRQSCHSGDQSLEPEARKYGR